MSALFAKMVDFIATFQLAAPQDPSSLEKTTLYLTGSLVIRKISK
jgi:hypothetical protein